MISQKPILVLFFLTICSILFSQDVDTISVCSIDTSEIDLKIITSEFDSDGNIILGGYRKQTVYWWETFNLLLEKRNSNGELMWSKTVDGYDFPSQEYYSSYINGIEIDNHKNIYVTLTFCAKDFLLGAFSVSNDHLSICSYLLKYDQDGGLLWNREITNEIANTTGLHNAYVATDVSRLNDKLIVSKIDDGFGLLEFDLDGTLIDSVKIEHGDNIRPPLVYNPNTTTIYTYHNTRIAPRLETRNGKIYSLGANTAELKDINQNVLLSESNHLSFHLGVYDNQLTSLDFIELSKWGSNLWEVFADPDSGFDIEVDIHENCYVVIADKTEMINLSDSVLNENSILIKLNENLEFDWKYDLKNIHAPNLFLDQMNQKVYLCYSSNDSVYLKNQDTIIEATPANFSQAYFTAFNKFDDNGNIEEKSGVFYNQRTGYLDGNFCGEIWGTGISNQDSTSVIVEDSIIKILGGYFFKKGSCDENCHQWVSSEYDSVICGGEDFEYSPLLNIGNDSVLLEFYQDNAIVFLDTSSINPSGSYDINTNELEIGSYWVLIKNFDNTILDSLNFSISNPLTPTIPDTIFLDCNNDLTLDLNSSNFSVIEWSDGTTESSILLSSANLSDGFNSFWVNTIDTNGCSATTNFVVEFCPLNVQEFTINLFELYPNPTSSSLFISSSFNEKVELIIIDANGRKVVENVFVGSVELNVSSLETGVYLVMINKDNNVVYQEKLLIKK